MFYGFAMMAVGLLNLAVCFLSTRGGFPGMGWFLWASLLTMGLIQTRSYYNEQLRYHKNRCDMFEQSYNTNQHNLRTLTSAYGKLNSKLDEVLIDHMARPGLTEAEKPREWIRHEATAKDLDQMMVAFQKAPMDGARKAAKKTTKKHDCMKVYMLGESLPSDESVSGETIRVFGKLPPTPLQRFLYK